MSAFFIDRPIFAWVIGLILMLIGGVEIFQLPIAQYPSIAAPQISITVTYPGASAQTVADTVVRPIQQQLNGLDGLEYLSSTTQSSGSMEIDATFKQGTDVNIAQVQVQNKLSLAEAVLPTEVTQQGIRVTKATKSFMVVIGFISADGSMSAQDIADYVASNVQDSLSRVSGVGDYTLFGAEYAMRIWLDPAKLYKYALTVSDVTTAISAENIQVSSGEIGGLPASKGQRLDATIIGPTRYETPEQFENILLKVNLNGSQVLLKDVARVELGAQIYSPTAKINHAPAAAIALKLAAGANQLATEAAVRAELAALRPYFPPGLNIVYPLDTEPFITLSITEVVKTLLEAIVLVFVVMYVFLQNFRATLIPTIAVPVVLLGTFGVLAVLGYTINTLTMLAMVLAVGLLVDDAIVVVENVERVMEEDKLSPRDATRKSHDTDIRCAGRHRAGAVRGVPADGIPGRIDRRDLPAVLGDHRFGDGAVGTGGADPDTGPVRQPAEAEAGGARPAPRTVRLVQQRLRLDQQALRRRRWPHDQRIGLVDAGLRPHRRDDGILLHQVADRFPAR